MNFRVGDWVVKEREMFPKRIILKVVSYLSMGAALRAGSCLPDNFWSDQPAQILNSAISGIVYNVVNSVLGGVGT